MPEKILIVSGPLEGHSYIVDPRQECIVGRGRTNSIIINLDPCLSTRHARLIPKGHSLLVRDLNSSNGSFIEGKKLNPAKEYRMKDFLVLGSTIFKKDPATGVNAQIQPWPLSQVKLIHPANADLFKKAKELMTKHHKAYMDTSCLLLAFFELNPQIMNRLCSDFMLDPEFLRTHWIKNRVFDVPNAWLNDFLSISHKQPLPDGPLVSPLARHVLSVLDDPGDLPTPIDQIRTFLTLPFNLTYPMLDWEKTKIRWSYSLEKLAQASKGMPTTHKMAAQQAAQKAVPKKEDIPVYSSTDKDILILPNEFWHDLSASITNRGQSVLLGHKGCGKSSILHKIFNPAKPHFSQWKTRVLYDSKVFLILNNSSKLKRFVNSLIRDLSILDLVGIDHIDHLLVNLQELGIERGPLLQALKKASAKIIIGIDMDNRSMIGGLLENPQILHIGNYLDQVREQLYIHLLRKFELRVNSLLTSDARHFIQEFVIDPSPDNIAAITDFLDFGFRRAEKLAFPFQTLTSETLAGGQLGKTFFLDLYSDWVGLSKGQVTQEEPQGQDPFQEFAFQLEDLVQAFSKNALKIGLHYSDQTGSLRDHRSMTEEEKLQQLKSQIVCLLTAYQHGFQKWFPYFWHQLSPETFKKQSNNIRKLWQLFEEKAEFIDPAYAEDQFNEATSRVFQELYRQ